MSGRAFHQLRRKVEVLHAVATPPCHLRLWRPCAPFVWLRHLRFTVGCQLGDATRHFPRALAVALCFAQSALVQPFAIMRSIFVLCLALCAFGHCFASSLRVERRGLSREGRVGAEAFMLINGKSGPQEMCLTITDGASIDACVCVCVAGLARSAVLLDTPQGAGSNDALVLESCVDAVAAGDGRELWVMQPGGRIAALHVEKCISDHDGLVSLSDCEASDAWELQANNELKSASGGGGCLSGSGASSGSNVALRAAVHASSAIDVAHGARRLT